MKHNLKWYHALMIGVFIISAGIAVESIYRNAFSWEVSVQTHVIEVSVEQLEFVIKENFEVFVGEDDWQLFGVWIDNVDGVASLMFQLNLWGE
tara:strand:+ start:1376 stop:1654 length:279 start_codon:yes stop_codon:yes gene_type:complete